MQRFWFVGSRFAEKLVTGVKLREATLKGALGYKKFAGEPRLLVLDTGYLVVGDVVDGAEALGWTVTRVPTEASGRGDGDFVGRLLKSILLNRPDFIVTVNHLGFDEHSVLAGLLAEYNVATASWFVDHPMPILGPAGNNESPYMQVFSFERTSLQWLAEHGYESPIYLPTGANRRHFHQDRINPILREKLICDVSFAGNSWWSKARLEPSASVRKAAEKAAKAMRVNKGALLDDFELRLEKIFAGNRRDRYAAAQVMLAEASMQKRGRFARSLLTVGIRIHGDPAWSKLAPGVDLHPFLDNKTALPALFSASKVNANVTAEQMPTAVNQRVWDVPAVGGFLLTDDQEDAISFFREGEEIAVYRTFEEAADKSTFYLRNENLRSKMSARALQKVNDAHTVCHRLQEMWNVMKKRFG